MSDICPVTGKEVKLVTISEDYGSLGSGGSYEELLCPDCGKVFWRALPD